MKAAFALLLVAAVASADTAVTRERTVTRLAEGAYVIRHPDAPLARLDATTIVPGHGEILRDFRFLHRVAAFLDAVNAAMSAEVYRSPRRGDLETVKAAVLASFDVAPWRKEFAGDDPGNLEYFDDFSWPGILKASHAELSRRKADYVPHRPVLTGSPGHAGTEPNTWEKLCPSQ